MRSVPVVLVDPRGEVVESVGGVLVEPSVGPFSDSGLDKSFRLTIGAGSVDASADVFDGEVSASLSKERGIETGSVVGHDPSNMDTEPGEISHGLAKEGGRRGSFFIRKHGGVGDAGVVIHGDGGKQLVVAHIAYDSKAVLDCLLQWRPVPYYSQHDEMAPLSIFTDPHSRY